MHNKVDILCERNHAMLSEFSRRSLAHITGHSVNSFTLPFVANYLEANVVKEADKDRIIIEYAASACVAGACAQDLDVELIFEKTKAVDHDFVKKLTIPSLMVKMQYQDIADIRKKRIRYVSGAVMKVLQGWPDQAPFDARMRQAFSDRDFRTVLNEILHLYNQETLKLSSSIKLFHPFNISINLFAETVFDAMERASHELVEDCTNRIYAAPSHARA